MIQLDTSFLIRALVRDSPQDRTLRNWLLARNTLAISAVAWAEFLCGPVETAHVELATQVVAERIPFVEEDAVLAARLFNDYGRRRGSLADCMIAATAVRANAQLATANPSDFCRFEPSGLMLVIL